MGNDRYQKVADSIKCIFEKEFGILSKEEFIKVAKLLIFTQSDARTEFGNFYKNLSEDEKKQIDFMMHM